MARTNQLGFALALLFAAGCAKELPVAEVEGVVTSAGKPLSRIRVQFLPEATKGTLGPVSAAATDEQGHFKLLCADKRSGAIVGWHKVVVTDMNVGLMRSPRNGRRDDDEKLPPQKIQPPRVPKQYWMVNTTPLLLEVKPQKQQIDLEVSK